MKCDAEQSALVVGIARIKRRRHAAAEVKGCVWQQGAVLNHADQAVLLQDKQAFRIARWIDRIVGRRHACGNRLQMDGDCAVLHRRQVGNRHSDRRRGESDK